MQICRHIISNMGYWVVILILVGLVTFAFMQYAMMRRRYRRLSKVLTDETKYQLLSSDHYRYILDRTKDAFLVLNAEGKIMQCNEKACRMLLYEDKDLIGRGMFDMDTHFSQETWPAFWQHLQKHQTFALETDFIRKDGAPVQVKTAYYYIRTKEHSFCFCLADDISMLKQAKEQLLVAKDNIEGLRAKLLNTVQQANKPAVNADNTQALKNEFLLTVALDIKTSLKGMMNMLDYLYKTAFGDTQQVFAQNAHSTAHGILMTIENMLDSTRAKTGDLILDRTSFRCQQIIDRTFRRLRPLAKDKRVRLNAITDPSVPHHLHGDANRIERILFNLVVNALSNNNTGDIYLRIKLLDYEKSSANIEFTIKDHDDSNNQATVQSSAEVATDIERILLQTSYEDNLRLSISRILIASMGGKIWTHQRLGHSDFFFFTLNLETNPPPDTSSNNPEVHESDGANFESEFDDCLNILVSEDSFVHQQIIKLSIRALSHQFTNVRTGKPTVQRLHDHAFDILLIDIASRKGLETLKTVSKLAAKKRLYIIGMTALQHTDVQECAPKLNIDDILTKPIDQAELKLALQCALAAKNKYIATNKPTAEPIHPGRMQSPQNEEQSSTLNRFAIQPDNEDVKPLTAEEMNALVNVTYKQEPKAQLQPHQIAENAILKLKRNFIDTTPDLIAQIYNAAIQEDGDLIKTTAQAIKASIAYFDANEIEAPIDKIIHLSDNNNFSEIVKVIDELKDAFMIVLKRMEEEE